MSAAAQAFPVCGESRVAFSANMAVWRQSLNDPRGRNCTVCLEQRIFCGGKTMLLDVLNSMEEGTLLDRVQVPDSLPAIFDEGTRLGKRQDVMNRKTHAMHGCLSHARFESQRVTSDVQPREPRTGLREPTPARSKVYHHPSTNGCALQHPRAYVRN